MSQDNLIARSQTLFAASAACVDKVAQLAQGTEAWLIGSLPGGVDELADEFESQVRLSLATVGFSTKTQERYRGLLAVGGQLRAAHRGAMETARLLRLLESVQARETLRWLRPVGDSVSLVARVALNESRRPSGDAGDDLVRLYRAMGSAIAASEPSDWRTIATMGSAEHRLTARLGHACLICLEIAGTSIYAASLEARRLAAKAAEPEL